MRHWYIKLLLLCVTLELCLPGCGTKDGDLAGTFSYKIEKVEVSSDDPKSISANTTVSYKGPNGANPMGTDYTYTEMCRNGDGTPFSITTTGKFGEGGGIVFGSFCTITAGVLSSYIWTEVKVGSLSGSNSVGLPIYVP